MKKCEGFIEEVSDFLQSLGGRKSRKRLLRKEKSNADIVVEPE